MSKKILVTHNLFREGFTALDSSEYHLIFPEKDSFSKEEVINRISACDALLSVFSFPVTSDIIDAGKNLKIISNFGVGYNNIDIDYAQKKGIVVTNTPEPVVEPTAELAFALMSDLSRNVSACDRKIRNNEDVKWGVLDNLGIGLWGKTLGIIGMGRIGRAVARRAIAAGMSVVYYNRNRLPVSVETEVQASYLSLDALLKCSDYISLHTPLNSSTHHLINEKSFSLMKPEACVINTARGAVIDEHALVEALQNNRIAGAALDVYENEPRISKELLEMKNVVLVPHIGTATRATRNEMSRYAAENIRRFFEKEQLLSRVV